MGLANKERGNKTLQIMASDEKYAPSPNQKDYSD